MARPPGRPVVAREGPRRAEYLRDPEAFLRARYLEQRAPVRLVAAEIGVSRQTVHQLLARYGVPSRLLADRPVPGSKAELIVERLLRGDRVVDVAASACAKTSYVYEVARRWCPERVRARPQPLPFDEAELRRLYLVEKRTGSEIALRFEVSPNTVYQWLKRVGVEPRAHGRKAPIVSRAWLVAEYVEEDRTTASIAAEIGLSYSRTAKILREHGIRKKPR